MGFVVGLVVRVSPADAEQVVVIEGRGFGHGVGMAQDGAYWLGRSGRSAAEILRVFYPGTTTSSRSGTVRVPLLSAGSVTIGFPAGGTFDGRPIAIGSTALVSPAGTGLIARVTTNAIAPVPTEPGAVTTKPKKVQKVQKLQKVQKVQKLLSQPFERLRVETNALDDTTTLPPNSVAQTTGPLMPPQNAAPPLALDPEQPSTTTSTEVVSTVLDATPVGDGGDAAPSGSGVPATTRDTSTATAPAQPLFLATATGGGVLAIGTRRFRGVLEIRPQGGVRVVNELDVEQYLRGMGEIRTPDWPSATLQSQAIAARTFALRAMAATGEVCPTQRCQVYLGAQAEYPQMDAAVAATRGKVLTYNGSLAATFYSASGGGTIATPEEAFGSAGANLPYLVAGVYPTGDVLAWTRRYSMSDAARRLGYPGAIRALTITATGQSGRATQVTLDGDAGTVTKTGISFTAAFGLRSNAYTISLQQGIVSPTDANSGGGADAAGLSIDGGIVDVADAGAQVGLLAPPPTQEAASTPDSTPATSVVATDTTRQATARATSNTSAATPSTTTPTARAVAVGAGRAGSPDHTGDIVLSVLTFGLVAVGLSGLRHTRRRRL